MVIFLLELVLKFFECFNTMLLVSKFFWEIIPNDKLKQEIGQINSNSTIPKCKILLTTT